MICSHEYLQCLNEYDIVRKYRCRSCGEVMMCSCEEEFGVQCLPHQLDETKCSESGLRVRVTLGFQEGVCRECRGLPIESFPVAEIHGRSSKIKRYYWRELLKRELELFGQWAAAHGADPLIAMDEQAKKARKNAADQALQEIKQLHTKSPKYAFDKEVSQADVICKCGVEVVDIAATYRQDAHTTRVRVQWNQDAVSVEEYVALHYRELGYDCLAVESVPFHVLFGVYLWLVIEDPCDERLQVVGFGDRYSFESNGPHKTIMCPLPNDFGSPGYGSRRRAAIDEHFSQTLTTNELDWLFDYWLEPSQRLRQYLWAHREENIATARAVATVLPPEVLIRVLRYLIESYWERFLGWPDLLLYRDGDFFFAEVKSSKDKLSNDQKRWIRDNQGILGLPFKLVKVHKRRAEECAS